MVAPEFGFDSSAPNHSDSKVAAVKEAAHHGEQLQQQQDITDVTCTAVPVPRNASSASLHRDRAATHHPGGASVALPLVLNVGVGSFEKSAAKAAAVDDEDGSIQSENQKGSAESTADIEAHIDDEDAHAGGSGMIGTVANLVNTIIGSGVLALPSCAAKAGWALTVILLILSGFVTWLGVHYLTESARRIGGRSTSWGHAAAKTYPWMVVIVDICAWAVSFGLCVAYLGIASSSIPYCVEQFAPNLGKGSPLLQTWFWLLICWLLVALPLSMLRSVKFLGYTSSLAILFVLYTTTVVLLYTFKVLDPCAKELLPGETCRGEFVAFSSDAGAILVTIPVFFTAFSVTPSVFNIYNSMYKPTPRRLNSATGASVSMCWVLYVVIALCGYSIYGSNVAPNILNSFPVETFASIARLGTAFVVTVSFPLLMHPARDAVVDAIAYISKGRTTQGKLEPIVFYSVALLLNIAAAAIAFFNVSLDVILSITGSIGVVNLSLTIPFIFYYKLYEGSSKRWDVMKRRMCIPGAVFGLAMSVVCAYFSIAPLV